MEGSTDNSNEGSSRIPKFSAQPKKGILKRSGSVNSPYQQHEESAFEQCIGSSVSGTRSSATAQSPSDRLLPWLSSNSVSKIPKLSVTWWETSSAYGGDTPSRIRRAKSTTPPKVLTRSPENNEQYQQSLDEECEDIESVTSCGGSSIAGTWWFGRDTRFVPHCQKHKHSSTPDQYLTPTQRKNREIAVLKKQLRDALRALNDKSYNADGSLANQGLDQTSQTILNENKKLQSKLASICEEYEAKIDQIRQDYQRQSVEKEETLLFEFEELKSKYGNNLSMDSALSRSNDRSFMDSSTLTDPDLNLTNLLASQNQDLNDCRQQSILLQKRLTELEFLVHAYETEFGTLPPQTFAGTDDSHSTVNECSNKICATKLSAAKAQIEAYEKECYIWRTKASELEINSKQLMTANHNLQTQVEDAKSSHAAALDGAKAARKSSRPSDTSHSSIRSGDKVSCIEHNEIINRLENETSELRKTLSIIEKERAGLTDENRELYGDYNDLRQENEENLRRIRILEDEMREMRGALAETEDALRTSENALNDCDRQLLNKRTELEVAQLNCQKLRAETEKMNSDKANLEEKIRFLENVMVEAGVAIGNPSAARRKTSRMLSQQQVIFRAREVQTELGYLEEMKIENELKEVNQRYENLRESHGAQIMDLENRITEMATNLQLKTNLVTTLTNQLQLLQDEISSLHSGMERERVIYNQKMHELNLVAGRVPFLENDITAAREEMRAMEQEYAKEKDRFEKALASTASDVLKSQQDTSQFYRQRLDQTEKELATYKDRCNQGQQDMSDLTARLTLQRCELERNLENALHELAVLQKKVHIHTRSVEVQVLPDYVDKSVLCYVKLVDKDTEIFEDDLYDERKEQLIILQGELQVTRRQVEVLQEKLIAHNELQQQFSDIDQENSVLKSKCDDLERTCLETEQQRLLDKIDFDTRCQSLFEQNERMAIEEEEKYHQLETEFDNVRQEMQQLINQYELKRTEMKLRLETLESENEDKRKLENDVSLLQQTIDSLEMSFEREKAALLKKERDLENLRRDILSKNPSLYSSSMKESQSIAELQKKIQELAATGKELIETDIISDRTSTVYSGSVDSVPILAYSKVSKTLPYSGENTTVHSESASLCENSSTMRNPTRSDSGGLVQSIQAQTHLLQNLRAELKQEQNKSRNAKASLYERIQKLAKENQSGLLSSKSVSHQSLKEAFESSLLEKENDEESIQALLSSSQSPSVRDTVLDMKARILYLLHENQQLNTDMKSLKRSVLDFINRREITRLSTNSLGKINGSDESGASYATASAVNGSTRGNTNIAALPSTDEENNFFTISCQDLRSIREDLEKMMVSFDLNNIDRNAFTDKKTDAEDGFLIKWLKNELGREKCELDVLIKWYEMDKNQLELELTDTKLRLQWSECERQLLRRKLDSTTREARDLALELTFYKEEDALRPFGTVDTVLNMKKCFSEGHIAVTLASNPLKHRLNKTAKDLLALERRFQAIERERKDVTQELEMLRGEFVMYKMQRETEKPGSVLPFLNKLANVVEVPRQDYEFMKKQLHQAEQCAARLDSESLYWQDQIYKLKDQMRSNVVYKPDIIEKFRTHIDNLNSKLIVTKQAKDKMIQECRLRMSELTGQLIKAETTSASLESEVVRYGEQCLDLRQQFRITFSQQKDIIKNQKRQIEDLVERLKFAEESSTQLRKKFYENLALTDDDVKEIEENGSEAVRNLLKILHENTLRIRQLEQNSGDHRHLFELVNQDLKPVFEDLEREVAYERARNNRLEVLVAEMDAKHQMQLETLHRKLAGTVFCIESAQKSIDIENSLDLIEKLHAKLAVLTEEMEQKEANHKKMYQVMFERGVAKARDEMKSAPVSAFTSLRCEYTDTHSAASSSSSEWIYEKRDVNDDDQARNRRPSASRSTVHAIDGENRYVSSPETAAGFYSARSDSPPPPIPTIPCGPSTDASTFDPGPSIHHSSSSSKSVSGKDTRLNDDEVRLRFLRDSVFYYLMGRDTHDHLQAIMSILKFTEKQRNDVLASRSAA